MSGKSTPKSIQSPSVSGTSTPARSSTPVNNTKTKSKPDNKTKNKTVNGKLENVSGTKSKPNANKKSPIEKLKINLR